MSDEVVRCEAKTFRFKASLGGVPVTMVVRAFVVDGTARAIRSVIVLSADGERIPRVDVGRMFISDLPEAQ